jgi:hypothetical protein
MRSDRIDDRLVKTEQRLLIFAVDSGMRLSPRAASMLEAGV